MTINFHNQSDFNIYFIQVEKYMLKYGPDFSMVHQF